MKPNSAVERLAWDSDWLGLDVYRLRVGSERLSLGAALREVRARGAGLVYVSSPVSIPIEDSNSTGFELVPAGTKVVFSRAMQDAFFQQQKPSAIVISRAGPAEIFALRHLVMEASKVSRFRLDPGFPASKVEELYIKWVEQGLSGTDGRLAWVAKREDFSLPGGLITTRVLGSSIHIELLATSEDARGLGFGRALVQWVLTEGRARSKNAVTVTALEENSPACRFYESQGFRPISREHLYHHWLQPWKD